MTSSATISPLTPSYFQNIISEDEVILWSLVKDDLTIYAISNYRALILSDKNSQVESFYFKDLDMVQTISRDDKSGDLLFKTTDLRDSDGDLIEILSSGFFDISNIEAVEQILFHELNIIQSSITKNSDGLYANETLKWIGNPIPRKFSFISTANCILGTIFLVFIFFFLCASIYVLSTSLPSQPTAFLFSLLFMIAGVVMLIFSVKLIFSPYRLWKTDKKITYRITDKRALITKQGNLIHTITILPHKLVNPTIIYKRMSYLWYNILLFCLFFFLFCSYHAILHSSLGFTFYTNLFLFHNILKEFWFCNSAMYNTATVSVNQMFYLRASKA